MQHLSIFDYVAVSGSLDGRIAEYVDHLHEHFVDSCRVVDGHYEMPSRPGYSAELKSDSITRFVFPTDSYWHGQESERVVGSGVESEKSTLNRCFLAVTVKLLTHAQFDHHACT